MSRKGTTKTNETAEGAEQRIRWQDHTEIRAKRDRDVGRAARSIAKFFDKATELLDLVIEQERD
jgi:hypothetical protein